MSVNLALFQPEIAQNTGTLLRLGACLNVPLHIIEPLGFALSDQKLKRAGMDYVEIANYQRHDSWAQFLDKAAQSHLRPVLISTNGSTSFLDFQFTAQDVLILGQESVGFPKSVEAQIPHAVHIPMMPETRSLNVAIAGAMVLTEALRQVQGFPE